MILSFVSKVMLDELPYKEGYDTPVKIQLIACFTPWFCLLVYMVVRHLEEYLVIDFHTHLLHPQH